jgi:hypothetical protein
MASLVFAATVSVFAVMARVARTGRRALAISKRE